ncbi:DNA repair protein RadA [candidate division TM6 bacterium RIFCSPHIGHO2_12_FULL_38_8]|nr:MAG: DNA repair protein RadA [candidate division TM6 bacterium RIFCSPHIGHO2_12_FULL_38_8]
MVKSQNYFECISCSYQSVKWVGCCPECKAWNSLDEISTTKIDKKYKASIQPDQHLHTLDSIKLDEQARITSACSEWDRVAGGGIVPGSFILISGDPGIGKSTLLLQLCTQFHGNHSIIYFSSEESLAQVKLRFQRTAKKVPQELLFSDQASLGSIIEICKQKKPTLVIIDSIQSILTDETNALPGTITQLKETAFRLMRLAKENNIAIIATGHITKEGTIAGPKLLEHMVDAVFYLQKEDQWQTRTLRSIKNRFGSINEIGFFHMQGDGLQEIANINQHLLEQTKHAPGSTLVSSLEGSRPIFLELQALVVPVKYGIPQRIMTGIDHKHVSLIAAILEKYLHIPMSKHDIFFKISGGVKTKDQTCDLGIALALLSSYFQQPLPAKTIALAELSLTGQIKPIYNIDIHMKECKTFGFSSMIIANDQQFAKQSTPTLKRLTTVHELLLFFPDKNEMA